MMNNGELFRMMFARMWDVMDGALQDIDDTELRLQPKPHCNSIGWLAWHVSRVEDRWIHLLDKTSKEVWLSGWAERMGMEHLVGHSGAGMTVREIQFFEHPGLQLLRAYMIEVRRDTGSYIDALKDSDLAMNIKTWFGRKMTVGEALSHVVCELNQHIGQVSYLKGYIKGYQERIGSLALASSREELR